MITCKVCGQDFKSMITSTHLKKHNMKVQDYIDAYGKEALTSDEYREKRARAVTGKDNPNYGNSWSDEMKVKASTKLKGRRAWNKSIPMPEEQKQKLSEVKKDLFKNGTLVPHNKGVSPDDSTKSKISESLKLYFERNPDAKEAISLRATEQAKTREKFNPFEGVILTEEQINRRNEKTRNRMKERQVEWMDDFTASLSSRGFSNIDIDGHTVTTDCQCGKTVVTHRQSFTPSKFKEDYCQFCIPKNRSKMEMDVESFIVDELGITRVTTNSKLVIPPYELDIFIPDQNIAIEFCGLYWHSELFGKDKDYHCRKMDMCLDKGIHLIQIFEHEWLYHSDVVKSILRNKLGKTEHRIAARKCTVMSLTSAQANQFLKEEHLSGVGRSNYRYGLWHQDEIIAVATFSMSNISRKTKEWELNRMAFKKNHSIMGGAGKLLKAFVNEVDPETIVSFAERRYGNGDVYGMLGFNKVYDSPPNYWYFRIKSHPDYLEVKHRFALRKNYKPGIDDPNKTEWENRQDQGWNRIWDCGHAKWVWNKPQ